RLGPGEAEAALVGPETPRPLVLAQGPEARRHALLGEPRDLRGPRPAYLVDALRTDELHRARAVLADVREQAEGVRRRDLELAAPALEHAVVVRQQAPEERVDRLVAVLGLPER